MVKNLLPITGAEYERHARTRKIFFPSGEKESNTHNRILSFNTFISFLQFYISPLTKSPPPDNARYYDI
jgi:hypothetical protein